MGDYPDPDEEYELMYADDLEVLHDNDEQDDANTVRKKSLPAKRSLDFSSPATKKISTVKATTNTEKITEEISLTPQLQPMEDLEATTEVNVSSKRTTEDLFGDIGDIDFDDIQQPSKRQKTEEEVDLELINKIVEGRKLRQLLLEPNNLQNGISKQNYNAKDNLSLNIPRWAFMPLTNADGDRVYVRLESEEYWDSSLSAPEDYISLQSSYHSTWEEARKILEAKQQEVIRQSQEPLPDVDSDLENSALWVDKYRPESYVDLLSEEPVNRALLHWLHLWDKVVFKKEVKTKDPQQRSTFSKRAGQFQLSNKWRGKKESEPEMDPDGRPHHKVALLCGPPGVGKTTLAHLLARLAGYRPVELNASDERSVEAFRNALQAATLMRAVLDKERRPNCLVLDEIDGAPLPTVELLVKWCGATAADAGKKKPKSQPLKRPVIAICNDLYASSLRPLRPVSLIIHVGGVSLSRMAARLSIVCERERVSAAAALPALAARANGDVRAAIQLLSFVRRKGQLTIKDVENSAIGTKDCTKTMMQALKAVFTVNDSDPQAAGKVIQAAGEYDRLMDGIFENYLSSRVDSRLHLACEALSWLCLHDLINSWTMRSQNYSLYGMLPLCGVRCHQLLAARHYQRIAFPMVAQEVYRRKTECESVTWSVARGRAASITASKAALQRDILPMLPYLLAPNLRSANVQLCSDTERAALRTAAGAMCDYGLTYAQRRGQDGLYHHALEPDVTRVAFYGNEERVRTPPAVKQAIAREQQLEMIRRTEEMASRVVPRSNTADAAKKPDGKGVNGAPKEPSETRLPNHLQRLKPKDLQKSTPQVHKDFFGRIVPLSQVHKNDAVPDVISSSSVFYQYREGFNNAVRRNVRTKDLL